VRAVNAYRRQAHAAVREFTAALDASDVDLPDFCDGYRITPNGTVLVQLRPLHPEELRLLADALHP
jgi:hypothetical protein